MILIICIPDVAKSVIAGAIAWFEESLRKLPDGPASDFERYLVIPFQVRFGKKESALQAAASLSPGLRAKAYVAVAVVCAETGDTACAEIALEKMQAAAFSRREDEGTSDFVRKLDTLNVTAALIDYNQFDAARRWLATVDQPSDDVSYKMSIEPRVQLQRVVMLAREGAFSHARSLAISMRPNSIGDIERGTALRTVAVLETRKNGVASTRAWASTLGDSEDQAYAFLGIAQSLLNLDDLNLPYGTINIH